MTDAVRRRVEDLLRELAPQVLGTLIGRYGQFDACEDAPQEALLKTAQHWPEDGIPHRPRGWLLTVASRVLIDTTCWMARNHRLLATRAHLRELAGDRDGAVSDYREAARRTASIPERRYLSGRALALDH